MTYVSHKYHGYGHVTMLQSICRSLSMLRSRTLGAGLAIMPNWFSPPELISILTNTYWPLFKFCQIGRCNIISCCGFCLNYLDYLRVWAFLLCLLGICLSSSVKGLFVLFAHFLGGCLFLRYDKLYIFQHYHETVSHMTLCMHSGVRHFGFKFQVCQLLCETLDKLFNLSLP